MCVMQVALATLWSCFPVSASGADVLLFSLLHTSSGSSCSPETNHGLLRSSRSPFFLPVALTFYFKSFFLPLLIYFFFFAQFFFFPSLCLTLDRSASLWSHQSSPPLSMGMPSAQGKRPGPQRSSLPGRKNRSRGTLAHPRLRALSAKVI